MIYVHLYQKGRRSIVAMRQEELLGQAVKKDENKADNPYTYWDCRLCLLSSNALYSSKGIFLYGQL